MSEDRPATFRLFSEAGETLLAECGSCGRVLKIDWERATKFDEGYMVQDGVRCPCGRSADRVLTRAQPGPSRSRQDSAATAVRCPKCGSHQLAVGPGDFSVVKGVLGGLLLGSPGVIAGLLGTDDVWLTCSNCWYHWKPGP